MNNGERFYGEAPVMIYPRPVWEFQAILEGEAYPVMSGQNLPRPKAPVLWIFPANAPHGWSAPPGRRSEVRVIHFTTVPEMLERIMERRTYAYVTLSPDQARQIKAIYDETYVPFVNPMALSPLVFGKSLFSLCLMVAPALPESGRSVPANLKAQKVERALHWYRLHLGRAPGTREAAAAVYVSPTHLRRLFHEIMDKSPTEAFTEVRMETARQLIAEQRVTLAQVAEIVGFSEASALSRAYRRHFGHPPSRDAR